MSAAATRARRAGLRLGRTALGTIAFAALAIGLLAPPAAAAVAAIGTIFAGFVPFNDKQVPLPEGDWLLVGDGYQVMPSVHGGVGDVVEDIVLFRMAGSRVAAFVIAHRNVIGVDQGWGAAADCDRDDIHLAVAYDDADNHVFCGFVNHVITSMDDDEADNAAASWAQALGYVEKHELTLPRTWLMAGFRLTDTADLLDVRYHFDPALTGLASAPATTWLNSEWSPASVAAESGTETGWMASAQGWAAAAAFWRAPEKPVPTPRQAVVRDLVEWLGKMRYPVELGFRNRVAQAGSIPMPWTVEATRPDAGLAIRMARLDAARSQDIISQPLYDQQRDIIQGDHGSVASLRWSAEDITSVKALTDQLTTKVFGFAADFYVTGSIATTVSLLGVQTVADLGQYWSTEWLWNTFGPNAAAVSDEVELTAAGADGPPEADEPRPAPPPAKSAPMAAVEPTGQGNGHAPAAP